MCKAGGGALNFSVDVIRPYGTYNSGTGTGKQMTSV